MHLHQDDCNSPVSRGIHNFSLCISFFYICGVAYSPLSTPLSHLHRVYMLVSIFISGLFLSLLVNGFLSYYVFKYNLLPLSQRSVHLGAYALGLHSLLTLHPCVSYFSAFNAKKILAAKKVVLKSGYETNSSSVTPAISKSKVSHHSLCT